MKVRNEQTSCIITPSGGLADVMDFGVDHEVLVEFQYEERFKSVIKSGLNVGLYEGNKLVGHGYLK